MDTVLTQQLLGGLAVVLGAVGYVFYIHGIIKGKVKPHAFSWFVWGLLTAIAFVAQVADGGGPGAWVTGFTALMCIAFTLVGLGASSRVFIAKSDWFYFVGALTTIPLWYFTGSPLLSVILITVIDALAFIPTFRKAYKHPETESVHTYTLSGIKFIPSIFALQNFSVVTVLYPASLILMNALFVGMVLWRKHHTPKT